MMHPVTRRCLQVLTVLFQAALLNWACCAPIVWIVRDGLGPDSQESGWGPGLVKFLVICGIPALLLTAPLLGLSFIQRRWAKEQRAAMP
jgi:hypothetical protein